MNDSKQFAMKSFTQQQPKKSNYFHALKPSLKLMHESETESTALNVKLIFFVMWNFKYVCHNCENKLIRTSLRDETICCWRICGVIIN